jgi:regulatory protein
LTGSEAKARTYALMLLRYRGRSEKELRDRLTKKGYQQEDIGAAVVYLKEYGYLDDRALAENLKHQAMTGKLLGFEGTRRFMRQRGLPRDIIDGAMRYDEATELVTLEKLIDKRRRTVEKYPEPRRTRSLIGFLMRKGYPLHLIRKALNNRIADEEMEA